MVIDFHVHLFPDKLADRAVSELAERSGLTPEEGGTVAKTRTLMERDGVSMSVVQNIATNARQARKVNEFAAELDKEPDFVAFGSVHPDCDWEYELDALADSGIKGIKLHPDYQGFYVNDPKMQPIYEGILKRDFILMFHAGLDLGLPDPVHCTPERTADTLALFRGEKVVFAHSGGFRYWQDVEQYLLGEDIYLDTSMTDGFMPKERREEFYRAHDEQKLLFATDFPWGGFAKEIKGIRELSMSDAWKENVLHHNAERLLGLG